MGSSISSAFIPEATFGGSGDVLTSSVTGVFRALNWATVRRGASAGRFSLFSTLKSSFLAGDSLTLRFCRLVAACESKVLVKAQRRQCYVAKPTCLDGVICVAIAYSDMEEDETETRYDRGFVKVRCWW
jgi:hypothetical protein